MDKIKIGVIGTGHLGKIHTKLWKNNTNIELIGVYDIEVEKAEQVANEFGCYSFKDIDSLLENVNAVTIATTTTSHFEISRKAILKGIHCLIEKPLTQTYSEAVELIKIAKETDVKIQVGHVERFNPALISLRQYQLQPLFIEAHRLSQFKPRATDVSVVLDLMIHDIDIMLWLIKSKVKNIYANGVSVLTETTDIANARITFENGAVANLTSSRITAKPMRKMRLFQKNAYISIDFAKQDVEVFRLLKDGETSTGFAIPASMLGAIDEAIKNQKIVFEKPKVIPINAIEEEQKCFIESIIDNSPITVSAEDAAEAIRIAELISNQINENLS
jgi:predicted dehydrogenase